MSAGRQISTLLALIPNWPPDDTKLMFLVFDLLQHDGADLRALPLQRRKRDSIGSAGVRRSLHAPGTDALRVPAAGLIPAATLKTAPARDHKGDQAARFNDLELEVQPAHDAVTSWLAFSFSVRMPLLVVVSVTTSDVPKSVRCHSTPRVMCLVKAYSAPRP